MTAALNIRDLHKSFGVAKIINGVNLSIEPGERHAIIGPNGAGKSTLFNLISGRFTPSRGTIDAARAAHFAGSSPIRSTGWACRAVSRCRTSSRT